MLQLLLAACAGVFPFTPVYSVNDLRLANMYAYMLPAEEVERNNWTVRIAPFQLNCALVNDVDYVFQPLYIDYLNDKNEIVLRIRISDGDPFVAPVTPDRVVALDHHSDNGGIEYYERSNGGHQVYFRDSFGLDIAVESIKLPADEVIRLTSILEYVGAKPEDAIVAWRDGCS